MADCCEPGGYDSVFDARFVRRVSRRYGRRGLTASERAIVSFLADRGIEDATVLEIGGGIGEIQVELLRLGAARATNLEISTGYEDEAGRLLERFGLRDRVERRLADIAQQPDVVGQADVVVLHRVVCCYPDYERLLGAAAAKADRMLVFSHPPDNVLTRAALWVDNTLRQLRRRGGTYRSYVHPPREMRAVATRAGLRATYRWRGLGWAVVGFEREPARLLTDR